jgi:heptosyltransferase-2/heptosyltransferase-3
MSDAGRRGGRTYELRQRRWLWLARAADAIGDRWLRRHPAAVPAAPRDILFIRLDHLGDMLFATPALRALRVAFPQARLTVLAGPWAAPVLQGGDLADHVQVEAVPWFAGRAAGWAAHAAAWWRVWRWMRRHRFDVALEPRGDVRHLAWLWLARVPVRIGRGATGGGWSLTHEIAGRDVHEVERNVDAVRVLTATGPAGPLVPVRAAPAAAATALVTSLGVAPQARIALVHAGAGYATKRWEPQALAACLERVADAGLVPVCVGGEADRDVTRALVHACRAPLVDAVGRTPLPLLAALCQHAGVFLGHDSGPAHVAVAAGARVVLVYSGVNDPRRWGPWGGRTQVFAHAVACSPCGLRHCPFAHECMRGIDPRAVAAAVIAAGAEAR